MSELFQHAWEGLGRTGVVAVIGWLLVVAWMLVDGWRRSHYRSERLRKARGERWFGASGSVR